MIPAMEQLIHEEPLIIIEIKMTNVVTSSSAIQTRMS